MTVETGAYSFPLDSNSLRSRIARLIALKSWAGTCQGTGHLEDARRRLGTSVSKLSAGLQG